MKNIVLGSLLLVLALTVLSMIPVHRANAVTYNAGVAAGNSFVYQVSTYWNTSRSPFSALSGVSMVGFTITKVSSPIVNGTQAFSFNNGTASRSQVIQGDLSTGNGNLSFVIIPAGLNSGDSFRLNSQTVTLNSSAPVTALGVSRTADYLNTSSSFGGGFTVSDGFAWDKDTGALLSFILKDSMGGSSPGHGGINILLTSNNVWSANILGLSPILFYAIVGIIIVVVAAVAVVILRRRKRPAPSAQPAPPATQPPSP